MRILTRAIRPLLLLLAACATVPSGPGSRIVAADLLCEGRAAPLGLSEGAPRLSWRPLQPELAGAEAATSAWQVIASSSAERLQQDRGDLWDSGVVRERDARHASWGGERLESGAQVHWKLRLWDEAGRPGPWSAPTSFTVGLLDPSRDWGDWIGHPDAKDPDSPWLRCSYRLPDQPRRVLAHVASIGYRELWCNGEKVGEDLLMPSVSDLKRSVRASTYDLTAYLNVGENVLGFWLGSGWAAFEAYGLQVYPLAQLVLEVEAADGSRSRVALTEGWEARASSREHIGGWGFGSYGGERVDARSERRPWCTLADLHEGDRSGWVPAWIYNRRTVGRPLVSLEACEPTRAVEEIRPRAVEELRSGVWRVDFGRGFTGIHELTLHGEPGATVRLHTSEREEQECTYGQTSELVLDERGEGLFRHRFDYACGRWLVIEGAGRAPALDEVRGWLVRTAYPRITSFRCSDPLLQQVHEAVLATYESLTLGGYSVDCAHRERWGYGGDAHATMETALDHYALLPFYSKWLADWAAIQAENGALPFTCPTYSGGGGPAWSGIVVMLPWELWLRTGDERVLERAWPTIARWLAFLEQHTREDLLEFYYNEGWTADVYSFLGDWVPPGEQQAGGPPSEQALFFNNAYRVWNVRTAARIALELGKGEEAERLERRADELAAAVDARFYDEERGVYVSPRQTYLALPVLAELGDEARREQLFGKLCADVASRRHVDTGIHGTWMLVRLLLERGRADLLALVASQTDYPSWGHMLAQGATTIWEQWDGVHSRLHSSFLSIGAFFVEGLAGIRPTAEAPGYASVLLAPTVVPGLDWVECELASPRGRIRSAWHRTGERIEYDFVLPPGVEAVLHLPGEPVRRLPSGTTRLDR